MNETLIYIFIAVIIFIIAFLFGLFYGKNKMQNKIDLLIASENEAQRNLENEKLKFLDEYKSLEQKNLEEKNRLEQSFLIKEQELKTAFSKQEHLLKSEILSLQEKIKAWEEKWENEQKHFKEKEEKFKQEFENLAQKILDEKTEKFTKQNRENLDQILNPFTKAIKEFKEKVIETDKQSYGRMQALHQQLKDLKDLNARLSLDAQNLTKALKGESKTQGIWGETILNNLLEKSGLEKGREYFVQQSFTVESDGKQKRLQPDVIIHLPNDKKMIIDAKVSLTAYEKYINAENDEQAKIFIKQHIQSIKQHIDGLRKKNYDELLKGQSPEFILMFIPVEPAFSLALKEEPALYNYAFNYNIVMVTPSTLLATLKIVDNMWTNERQTRNAIEIAEHAGRLYDKFHGFVEDLQQIGNRLFSAQQSYNDAMNKLTTGKGNLLGRVEKLKNLGAKAKKQLPPADE